jgi:type II secretory pathway pseudopilin PulG
MRLAHVRPGAPPTHQRRADVRGETLIEIMVAVVIMGTSIVAILGAISTMIVSSGAHRGLVRTSNEASRIAELIQNANYKTCGGANGTNPVYPSASTGTTFTISAPTPTNANATTTYTAPAGYRFTIGTTQNLQSRGGPAAFVPSPVTNATYAPVFDLACPSPDQGVQQMTITMRAGSRDGKVSSTVTITKRSTP